MNTKNTPTNELLQFSTAKRMRRVLMKMFFAAMSEEVLSNEDQNDVYFLYEFLEQIDEE